MTTRTNCITEEVDNIAITMYTHTLGLENNGTCAYRTEFSTKKNHDAWYTLRYKYPNHMTEQHSRPAACRLRPLLS